MTVRFPRFVRLNLSWIRRRIDRAHVAPIVRGLATTTMLTRSIPRSGEPIPVIGLGTWKAFDPRPADDDALSSLRNVLKTFYEAGGRVIDSSPMYGAAEKIAGALAAELSVGDGLFVASKVWTVGERSGIAQMESSLSKFQRQSIDLMQVHNLDDFDTHIKTLRNWKEQKRLRYIGATHFHTSAFERLEKLVRTEQLDFIQIPYSLANREAQKRLLPAARHHGVAVLVNRPFEEGVLFRKAANRPLPQFARSYAGSWSEAFLKFILADEAVTCVLPATRDVQHLLHNLRAGSGRLPDERERAQLIAALS